MTVFDNFFQYKRVVLNWQWYIALTTYKPQFLEGKNKKNKIIQYKTANGTTLIYCTIIKIKKLIFEYIFLLRGKNIKIDIGN